MNKAELKECLIGEDEMKTSKDAIMNYIDKVGGDKDKYQKKFEAKHYRIDKGYLSKLPYRDRLKQHQVDGLVDCLGKKHNMLAFEQGLGKTITAASISQALNLRRTLIICPSIAKWNWHDDLVKEWGFNMFEISLYESNRRKIIQAFMERFVIINYELLDKYYDRITRSGIDHIVIDECHYIKNPTSKRFKAVKKYIDKFSDARVTFLSGTPIKNRADDMYAYLKLIGHPLATTKKAFEERFIVKRKGKVVGSKNKETLNVLTSNFVIRRRTVDCVNLPPLIFNRLTLPADKMSKEYNDRYQELMSLIKERKKIKGRIDQGEKGLEKRMFKVTSSVRGNIFELSRICSEMKVPAIIEYLNDFEGPTLVFSPFLSSLDMMEKKLDCVRVDGSTSTKERRRRIASFNKGDVKFYLANNQAGGIAVNLSTAKNVVFTAIPLTPDMIWQPLKRAHRIGQKNSVNVYHTILKSSIDEHLYDIISKKEEDINDILDKGKGQINDIPEQLIDKLT